MKQYQSPADLARTIRRNLKSELGATSRQISVRTDTYSMGASIDVEIKAKGFSMEEVEAIAKQVEKIDRCGITGEILSGGNLFVSVSLASSLVNETREEIKEELEALHTEGTKSPNWVKTFRGVQFYVNDDAFGSAVILNKNDGAPSTDAFDFDSLLFAVARRLLAA